MPEVIKDHQVGQVAGGDGAFVVHQEIAGCLMAGHLDGNDGINAAGNGFPDDLIDVAALQKIQGVFIIGGKHAPGVVLLIEQRQECPQILGGGALPYHDELAELQLFQRILAGAALVIGIDAGGDIGVEIGAGCNGQYPNTYGVSAAELLPGDLGFLADDDGWGHVLIFAGYDAEGTRMWVHSSGGIGVILNTPSYEGRLSYRRLSIVDYDAPVVNAPTGEALYTLEVEVTHYCACAKCCGSNAQGLTASGKQAAVGMVAMSSHYPFGTQIMINGTMYTVEDRGGSGIENNIHRVDIYVPDHQQALRMGRYTTTATIYRLGR